MKNTFTQIIPFMVLFNTIYLLMVCPAIGQETSAIIDQIVLTKETYAYKEVDGHRIFADVYRNSGEDIRPAIIWIHGGALMFGNRKGIQSEQLKTYLNAGYTIIAIDYRLAPETKLDQIIEDVEDAFDWVATKGPKLFKIDPQRIGMVGHSAGAFLALVAGFRINPPPKALVSFYGYVDISGPWISQPNSNYDQMYTITKEEFLKNFGDSVISSPESPNGRVQYFFYLKKNGNYPQAIFEHDPVKERAWYSKYEPIQNISSEYPPTILLHGEKDTDIPHTQPILMTDSLKYHGVSYELVINPNWGHAFDWNRGMKDPEVKEAYNKVLQFLEKHLR